MKRFYVVLFGVLSVSVVLLGFSFSKESGSNELSFLNEVNGTDYRVVFSDGDVLNTVSNSNTMLSLINRKSEKSDIYITLKETNNSSYKNVFYKIDDGPEHVLVDETIKLGTLNAYGVDGDHQVFNIHIYTKDDSEYSFLIKVNSTIEEDDYSISSMIKNSNSVYTDNKGNVRYYGEDVNNYILYNEEEYRIIGIVDGKLKIISEIHALGVYDTSKGEYANLEDYLGAYNNSNVNINNVLDYKSWISDRGFWLQDVSDNKAYYASGTNGIGLYNKNVDFYLRYVYYLEGDSLVVAGNGSIIHPYEVSYGSK